LRIEGRQDADLTNLFDSLNATAQRLKCVPKWQTSMMVGTRFESFTQVKDSTKATSLKAINIKLSARSRVRQMGERQLLGCKY